MKHLTIILILTFSLLIPSYANGVEPKTPSCGRRFIVEIGQFPNCLFLGLCRIIFLGAGPMGTNMTDSPSDNIIISDDLKSFEIQLSKERLVNSQPDKLEYFEGKSTVTFTQGYEFPSEIRSALNASKDLMVRPGTYPLTFVDGIFTIKFPY